MRRSSGHVVLKWRGGDRNSIGHSIRQILMPAKDVGNPCLSTTNKISKLTSCIARKGEKAPYCLLLGDHLQENIHTEPNVVNYASNMKEDSNSTWLIWVKDLTIYCDGSLKHKNPFGQGFWRLNIVKIAILHLFDLE